MSNFKMFFFIAVSFMITPAIAGATDFSANIGAIEVLGVPDGTHFGVYPYLGGSAIIPAGSVTLIPGISVEWSPEFGHWGFVGTFVADYALNTRLGLDWNLALIHDQAGGDWGTAAYFLGAGPGVSIFIDKWAVSPALCLYHGLNVPGWTLVPQLNLAYTF